MVEESVMYRERREEYSRKPQRELSVKCEGRINVNCYSVDIGITVLGLPNLPILSFECLIVFSNTKCHGGYYALHWTSSER